jgi:hypothetical protein
VKAGDDLAARIRGALDARSAESRRPAAPARLTPYYKRVFPSLAAAAAILAVLVPAWLYLNTTSRARAAQMELLQIHQANLGEQDSLFASQDPNAVAAYFEQRMGYAPALIRTDPSMEYCGCSVRQSGSERVGTYLIGTAAGKVSVVVLERTPKALGMSPLPRLSRPGMMVWTATCDCCNMAAVRAGDRTYYALGQVPYETLVDVLSRLSIASDQPLA